MTNSVPLLQMFFEYSPEEPLRAVLEQAAVCRAEISREERRISLEVCFDRYVPAQDLQALSEGLQARYGIRTVAISPRFPKESAAQMEAAEESRAVYRAWNAVCSGTREGRHVTGLRYLPESNELLVYLDSPSWTQEMTLLREIIRARMERAGAHVDGLVFKTTAPGHTPPAAKERLRPAATERPPAPHADLSDAERTEIERQVAPIEDQKLREALENAMRASAEWAKGVQSKKEP